MKDALLSEYPSSLIYIWRGGVRKGRVVHKASGMDNISKRTWTWVLYVNESPSRKTLNLIMGAVYLRNKPLNTIFRMWSLSLVDQVEGYAYISINSFYF